MKKKNLKHPLNLCEPNRKKTKKKYKYKATHTLYIPKNTNISKITYYFTNFKKAKTFVRKKNKTLKNKLYILRNMKTNKLIST